MYILFYYLKGQIKRRGEKHTFPLKLECNITYIHVHTYNVHVVYPAHVHKLKYNTCTYMVIYQCMFSMCILSLCSMDKSDSDSEDEDVTPAQSQESEKK